MLCRRKRYVVYCVLLPFSIFIVYESFVWLQIWREIWRVTALNAVPPPGKVHKAMVLAKMKHENVEWAHDLRPEWTPYIYTAANPSERGYRLKPHAYRGREAIAYLSFIVDFYDDLPDITAFVHASDEQRHNEDLGPRTSTVLRNLRTQTVERDGYVNLRCKTDPNCPVGVTPHSPSEIDIMNDDVRVHFADHYKYLFNVTKHEIPREIGGVCCAQFALTRQQIQRRLRSDYERMRDWIIETKEESMEIGWVFESLWHIVFGKESIHCPEMQQCRCDLFGMGCESENYPRRKKVRPKITVQS